jgi:hypothetical protein
MLGLQSGCCNWIWSHLHFLRAAANYPGLQVLTLLLLLLLLLLLQVKEKFNEGYNEARACTDSGSA